MFEWLFGTRADSSAYNELQSAKRELAEARRDYDALIRINARAKQGRASASELAQREQIKQRHGLG